MLKYDLYFMLEAMVGISWLYLREMYDRSKISTDSTKEAKNVISLSLYIFDYINPNENFCIEIKKAFFTQYRVDLILSHFYFLSWPSN